MSAVRSARVKRNASSLLSSTNRIGLSATRAMVCCNSRKSGDGRKAKSTGVSTPISLTRSVANGLLARMKSLLASALVLCVAANAFAAEAMAKWQKGKGWGWVWGKEDQVGSLNEMTDASRASALRLATQGKVYDLGVVYDRNSYK